MKADLGTASLASASARGSGCRGFPADWIFAKAGTLCAANVPGLVMAVLSEVPELVGFFSYSREDDTDSFGRLSALRGRIQAELRGQLGRTPKTFRLWQDKEAIPSGTLWESEIKNAVSQAVFFIPIITPTVVASRYCRFELEAFLEREASLGRDDLIFPILYIDVPGLEDGIEFESDRVLSLIAKRQYVDWREFRYLEVDSTEVRREVGRFCTDIRNALRRRWVSPEEFKQQEDVATRQKEEEAARQKDEEAVRQRQQAERERQEAAKRRAQEEARQRALEQQGSREEGAEQGSVPAPEGGRGPQLHSAEVAQKDGFAAMEPPEQKGRVSTERKTTRLAAIIGAAAALILLAAVAFWLTTSSSTPPNPQLAAGNSVESASNKTPAGNASDNVPAGSAPNDIPAGSSSNNTPVGNASDNAPVDNNVPADGLTQHEIDACVNRNSKFSLDDQINGCTEAIRSGRWKGKDMAWAYGDRCIAHKDKAQYDVALRDCDEAITLNPQDAYAYNTRGAIYHLTNKYDQAIAEYSTAIKLDPKFIDPVHNRGMSYAAKGDLERAIDDYNAALRINPRDALALYERGIAKQKSGDQNGGNADIAAAKKIDPHIGD
ncbi:MAG TPA: tetratricopeptide repeat protein [Xanthobacteraceae bacterium]|nr:tetratricopeptide repeat protein [Xanthobacteraceae bacterium]